MTNKSPAEFKIIDIDGKNHSIKQFWNVHTYIIYYEIDGKSFLVDLPSHFLKAKSTNSLATSSRYANIIKKFFNWYAQNHKIEKNFWQNMMKTDIQEWQIDRWTTREVNGKKSPSNKTILDEATLVADMFNWIHEQGFYSGVIIDKKEVEINFGDSDMLNYVKERTSKEVIDNRSIQVLPRESFVEDIDFTLMNKEQIKKFIDGFSDEVYIYIFYVILTTGLRRSEVVQIPHIGEGKLKHVRQFKEMDSESRKKDTFKILVVGKGNKERKPDIPTLDWLYICELYEAELLKRRKLYKQTYGKKCPNKNLWLTNTGKVVTAKMITDAFTYNSRKTGIHIHPHDGRGWFATTFVAKALGDRLDVAVGYNAAIDEKLRIQLGHSNIRTTYEHYVKLAKLYKHINNGFTTDLFTKGNGFIAELKTDSTDNSTATNNNIKNKLLLIRGLPGSGKSTLAKLLSAYEHYEADMFFMKAGKYRYRQDHISEAHQWCQDQVRTNLQAGNNVVVSNSFITLNEMKPYFEMGFSYEVMTAAGEFKNKHNITEKQISEMREKWEDYDNEVLL